MNDLHKNVCAPPPPPKKNELIPYAYELFI